MNAAESALRGKIILFGGTFNPIHNGHLALCRFAYQAIQPKEVILIPTCPPYKSGQELAPPEDRLRMCRLATTGMPFLTVDDCELRKNRPCYTAETVCAMRARFPREQLYLLLGADVFLSFQMWHRWRACGETAVLLVGARAVKDREILCRQQKVLGREGIRSILLENPVAPISSTKIRTGLNQGRIPEDQLDPGVLTYIREKRLYQT